MQDKKNVINLRLEQSRVLEKLEELRQFVLTSSLRQDKVLRLNDTLDVIQFNIYSYYEDAYISQNQIGNI